MATKPRQQQSASTVLLQQHEEEFKQQWKAIEAQREVSSEQTTQLATLSKDVQVLTGAVNKMANTMEAFTTRIGNIEKPNLDLWIRLTVLVVAMGGSLWAMAIRPIQMQISNIQSSVQQIRAGDETLVTKARLDDELNHVREMSELRTTYEGKIIELKMERYMGRQTDAP